MVLTSRLNASNLYQFLKRLWYTKNRNYGGQTDGTIKMDQNNR